jgi:hypothetical protein
LANGSNLVLDFGPQIDRSQAQRDPFSKPVFRGFTLFSKAI